MGDDLIISYPSLSMFIISNLLPWTETRRSSCPVFCWVAFPPVVDSWNIAVSNKNKKVHYGPFFIISIHAPVLMSYPMKEINLLGGNPIFCWDLGWILRNRSHIESCYIHVDPQNSYQLVVKVMFYIALCFKVETINIYKW